MSDQQAPAELLNLPVYTEIHFNVTPAWLTTGAEWFQDCADIMRCIGENIGILATFHIDTRIGTSGAILVFRIPTDVPNEVRNWQLAALVIKQALNGLAQTSERRLAAVASDPTSEG